MAAMVLLGQGLGPALGDALGLPKGLIWFELRVALDEVVSIKCEYYPHIDKPLLESVIEDFQVVRREQPRKIDFDAWMKARKDTAHADMQMRHKRLARACV